MKRYAVTITVGISATNKKEAQRILKQIVESGSAMGSESDKFVKIILSSDPTATEIPF